MKFSQLKKVFQISKPSWSFIPLIFFFLVLYTTFTGVRAVLYVFLIDEIAINGQTQLFLKILLLLILTNSIRLIAPFYYHYLIEIFCNKLRFNLYLNISRHIQNLPLKYFRKMNSVYLSNRIITDIDTLTDTISARIFEFIASLLTLLIAILIGLNLSWKITLFIIICQPIYLFFIHKGSKKLQRYSADLQEAKPVLAKQLQDNFAGIYEIKSYNFQPFSFIWIGKTLKKYIYALLNRNIYSQFYSFYCSAVLLGLIVFVGFEFLGIYLIIRKEFTIGGLFAFQMILLNIIGPLRGIININVNFQSAMASVKRILSIWEEKTAHPEMGKIVRITGNIVLENIAFSYDKKPVLKDITAEIKSGEKVAIVGRTGAGKTTLVNLILKFLQPTKGNIYINNKNLNDIDTNHLRSCIAIVPQNVYIFNLSLRDNLKIGNPSASDEKLEHIIDTAGLREVFNRLPNGLDTKISAMGTDLSGGEKQRIGIARAILKNPDILIMDEALSQIDSYTEEIINQAIQKNFKGKTIITIAHRLSTIKNCDRILVLDNGKIVAQGHHERLVKTSIEYQKLYKEQFLI